MSNEIELKLALSENALAEVKGILSKFDCLQQQRVFLANTYYDSPERYFARHKMGLRVRQQNNQFTLTLKTDGNVLGGLHIRPEYNFPLTNADPDLSLFSQIEHLQQIPTDLALQAIFSTDFTRDIYLFKFAQAEIEVAVDQGEIKAQGKMAPICEIEFELKQGNIAELLAFVAQFEWPNGVYFSSASKAKRGYQLANSASVKAQDWVAEWRKIWQLEKTQEILPALFCHEQALIEETFALQENYFSQDFLRTVERIGAFFNLYHYYVEQAKHFATIIDNSILTELNESSAMLLAEIQQIIRQHSETKNNQLAINHLFTLLQRQDYLQRLLLLMRFNR